MQYHVMVLSCCLIMTRGMDTDVVVLRAVRGLPARLPCGQSKLFLDGPNSYVLWLKDDQHFLHRYPDDETAHRGQEVNTVCNEDSVCEDGTALHIRRVTATDGGRYRCRVHYQAAPSVDYVIDLRLVESPGNPKIYDGQGSIITKGYMGPLSLGTNITLICQLDNTPPDTLLYWKRNGVVIEQAEFSRTAQASTLRTDVEVLNITRNELGAHYDCLAQNADVTEPQAASVVINMHLPPLSVEIRLNNNLNFETGQPRVVDCVVVGCVPPPAISWHLGDVQLRPNVHKELHEGNYTVSSLTLAPALRAHGQTLRCRAHNPLTPDKLYEDNVTINVGYKPVCVSSRLTTVGVVSQEPETVICTVESFPEPFQIAWTFADSRTLYTSVKPVAGHAHRYTSTLSWVPRDLDLGDLQCRATNSFGEQKQACVFAVTAGSTPQTPDCVLLRSQPRALRVQCKKGWDGGRPQSIQLQLKSDDGIILQNHSSNAGHFNLQDVEENRNLTVVIHASNTRGQSRPTVLHLHTLRPLSAPATTESSSPSAGGRWARVVQACVGVAALAAVVGTTAVCVRARSVARKKHNPDLVPATDGVFHREPDFTREERVIGTTNITVNELAACENHYSPDASCRIHIGCTSHSSPAPPAPPTLCVAAHHSFYV